MSPHAQERRKKARNVLMHALMLPVMMLFAKSMFESMIGREAIAESGSPETAEMVSTLFALIDTLVVVGSVGGVALAAFLFVSASNAGTSTRSRSSQTGPGAADTDGSLDDLKDHPVVKRLSVLTAPSLTFGAYRYVESEPVYSDEFTCASCQCDAGTGERREYEDKKIRFGLAFGTISEGDEEICATCAADNNGVVEGWVTN